MESCVKFIRQIEDLKSGTKINVFYYRGWFLEYPITVSSFYKEQEEVEKFKNEIDALYDKYKSVNEVFNKQMSIDDLWKQ